MGNSGGDKPASENETIMSLSDSGRGFAAEAELPAGTKIGKYVVKRLIGRGGMGAVYEALDSILQRDVALKILPRSLTEDEQALRRFIREAQLAAKLNHPNVVTVYDVGRKGTTYFIAMELVRGDSSEDLLRKNGAFGPRDATRLIAGACGALVAAHKAGLIHRDIKPANILCATDGVVKLGDFGLAKLHLSDKSNLTLTQKDVVLGTPKYMSPEQCQNEAVDGRSDIYSLGAAYYTLLTGTAPYDRGTTMQILFAHCSRPVPDPRELEADTPEACTHIIRKAMAKKPVDRYQSAEAMLRDLERVLGGGAVASPRAAAAAEVSPMLSDLIDAMHDRGEPALPEGMRMGELTPTRRRSATLMIAAAGAGVVAVVAVAAVVLWSGSSSEPATVVASSQPIAQPTPVAPTAAVALTPIVEAASTSPVEAAAQVTDASTPMEAPPPVVQAPEAPPPQVQSPEAQPPIAQLAEALLPPSPPPDGPPQQTVEDAAASDVLPPPPPPPPQDGQFTDQPELSDEVVNRRFETLKQALLRAAQARKPQEMSAAVRNMDQFHHEFINASSEKQRQLSQKAMQLLERFRPPGDGRMPPERREPPPRDDDRRPQR